MKFNTIICLFVAFVLISCTKEDKDEMEVEVVEMEDAEMVGEWTMIAYDYLGSNTISSPIYYSKTDFVGTLKESDFVIEFKSDPNTYETSKSYVIELTSEVGDIIVDGEVVFEGYTDVQDAPIDDFESTGTWSVSGDMLSGLTFINATPDAESGDYEIVNLTDTKLELAFEVTRTTQDQGATAETQIEGTLVFER